MFFAIFLSPLIETFIFQWLVYEQLIAFSFFKKRIYFIILISGFIFGVIHSFSIEYQFFAFVLGCYLCFVYYYFKTYSKYAFLAVFIIHAVRNLLVVLGQFYLKS
ncbi:type II CAAX prenyl endopeptidase Rce1 family protein [Pedobacter xixiisoli]